MGSFASPEINEYCKTGAFGDGGSAIVTATPAGNWEWLAKAGGRVRDAQPQQHLVDARIHQDRQVNAEAVRQAEASQRLHPIGPAALRG
jgi:hypothetical protein